jgi:cell shape-determining protein MreC
MTNKILLAVTLFVAACGYESRDNELIGQVKKVEKKTPIICSNYASADISLGVLRNGVGSLSREDVWLYVPNDADVKTLESAVQTGDLVKVTYDRARVTFCVDHNQVSHVEVLRTEGAGSATKDGGQ